MAYSLRLNMPGDTWLVIHGLRPLADAISVRLLLLCKNLATVSLVCVSVIFDACFCPEYFINLDVVVVVPWDGPGY